MGTTQKIEFPELILKKLEYLNRTQKCRNGNVTILEYGMEDIGIDESEDSGAAHLQIKHKYPVISFSGLETNRWNYLNYAQVSDGLVLEYTGEIWKAHIFELKKKVTNKHWEKTKLQFAGTYLYLQMIKGFLDIEIDEKDILYYIGYRKEALQEQKQSTPIEIHRGLHRQEDLKISKAFREWKEEQVVLLLYANINCFFQKIILDSETGERTYELN